MERGYFTITSYVPHVHIFLPSWSHPIKSPTSATIGRQGKKGTEMPICLAVHVFIVYYTLRCDRVCGNVGLITCSKGQGQV